MREGRAGRRQGDAEFLGERHCLRGKARQRVQRNEIAASGPRPLGEAAAGETAFEPALNGLELRAHQIGVLAHVRFQVFAQKPRMAQLVDFVRADHEHREPLLHRGEKRLRAAEKGHAAGRESHLRSGCEEGDLVLRARFSRMGQDGFELGRRELEIVNGVGVVPKHQQRLLGHLGQFREAAHGVGGIDAAGRIGVLRHAPDAADRAVRAHEFFDPTHVRAVVRHRRGDQFHA